MWATSHFSPRVCAPYLKVLSYKEVFLRVIFTFYLFIFSFGIHAFDFGEGKIEIPFAFEGPVTANPTPGVEVYGFTKNHFVGGKSALLQISKFSPPGGVPKLDEEERARYSKQYLLQFLGGIERQRSNFEKTQVEMIAISGVPTAKINWNGVANGESLHGVMYCLIHSGSILSFHTQDFTSFDSEFIDLAVTSIESLELER